MDVGSCVIQKEQKPSTCG